MLDVDDDEEELPEDEELIGGGFDGFPLTCFVDELQASFSCDEEVSNCGTLRSSFGDV